MQELKERINATLAKQQPQLEKISENLVKLMIKKQKMKNELPSIIYTHHSGNSLYVGNYSAAANQEIIESRGITLIISCMEIAPNCSVKLKQIAVKDQPNAPINQYFNQSNQWIQEQLSNCGSVLLHCFAGKSRSPCIAASYLMLKMKIKYDQALKIISQKHPKSQINNGFIAQLSHYQPHKSIQQNLLEMETSNITNQNQKSLRFQNSSYPDNLQNSKLINNQQLTLINSKDVSPKKSAQELEIL